MPRRPEHDRTPGQIVCPECRSGMVHKLVVLHAGEDTLITCLGAWESLPVWLRESFGEVRKGQPVRKRREVVREMRDQLEQL